MTAYAQPGPAAAGPFDLDRQRPYREWRAARLHAAPGSVAALRVEVADPQRPSAAEERALRAALARANLVVYATAAPLDKQGLRRFAARLGLVRLDHNLHADADSVSSLRVCDTVAAGEYVPYTNRALNWHTDGYYNEPGRRIRAFLLHCVAPAERGGDNRFLDHELAYIHLRDREPRWVRALMRADAMSIPAHRLDGRERRARSSGPVFSVLSDGRLHMRYTARARNVQWHPDPALQEARAFLHELLERPGGPVLDARLAAGEGVVCANVLHCRSAFEDAAPGGRGRLLYRARFLDPVPLDGP